MRRICYRSAEHWWIVCFEASQILWLEFIHRAMLYFKNFTHELALIYTMFCLGKFRGQGTLRKWTLLTVVCLSTISGFSTLHRRVVKWTPQLQVILLAEPAEYNGGLNPHLYPIQCWPASSSCSTSFPGCAMLAVLLLAIGMLGGFDTGKQENTSTENQL